MKAGSSSRSVPLRFRFFFFLSPRPRPAANISVMAAAAPFAFAPCFCLFLTLRLIFLLMTNQQTQRLLQVCCVNLDGCVYVYVGVSAQCCEFMYFFFVLCPPPPCPCVRRTICLWTRTSRCTASACRFRTGRWWAATTPLATTVRRRVHALKSWEKLGWTGGSRGTIKARCHSAEYVWHCHSSSRHLAHEFSEGAPFPARLWKRNVLEVIFDSSDTGRQQDLLTAACTVVYCSSRSAHMPSARCCVEESATQLCSLGGAGGVINCRRSKSDGWDLKKSWPFLHAQVA